MCILSTFVTENYPHQLAAASLFLHYVDSSLFMEVKSGLIKGISVAKMSESFAIVEAVIKHTFPAFSLSIYLLLGSQGCSLLLLELLMD